MGDAMWAEAGLVAIRVDADSALEAIPAMRGTAKALRNMVIAISAGSRVVRMQGVAIELMVETVQVVDEVESIRLWRADREQDVDGEER